MGEQPAQASGTRLPPRRGTAVRDGVALAWEAYGPDEVDGADGPTILLVPTWQLVHSRAWKAQIGHLSRRRRVVVFDGRGTGRSDRPEGAAA